MTKKRIKRISKKKKEDKEFGKITLIIMKLLSRNTTISLRKNKKN